MSTGKDELRLGDVDRDLADLTLLLFASRVAERLKEMGIPGVDPGQIERYCAKACYDLLRRLEDERKKLEQ